MNVEKYLQDIRDMKEKIDTLEKMKMEVTYNIGIIKSRIDSDNVQHMLQRDKNENKIIRDYEKIKLIEKEIVEETVTYICKRKEAYDQIMKLKEGQCRRFLVDFFINGKNEIEIAYDYHFENISSVYKLKHRAMNYFSKVV